MNAQQKETFHLAILSLLDRNRTRWGLSIIWLARSLAEKGFTKIDFGNNDEKFFNAIADALEYLTSKRLVEEVLKNVDPANRSWRITTDGIDYLDQKG
jgi:hypothetical protein